LRSSTYNIGEARWYKRQVSIAFCFCIWRKKQ